MSDRQAAEEQIGVCGEQVRMRYLTGAAPAGGPADRATPPEAQYDWAEVMDRLISWAIAQADAAVDEICAYLAERSGQRQPPVPGRQRGYRRSPYRGQAMDHACSALRRRLRARHAWAPRPLGAVRPPRHRRLP